MIANSSKNHTLFVRVVVLLCLVLFFSSIITAAFIRNEKKRYQNKIYPHVFIDDLPVGNKTKKDVLTLFNNRQKKLKDLTMFISYNNAIIATYSASTLNIRINIDDMYEKAYLIGQPFSTSKDSYLPLKFNTIKAYWKTA